MRAAADRVCLVAQVQEIPRQRRVRLPARHTQSVHDETACACREHRARFTLVSAKGTQRAVPPQGERVGPE